MRVEISKIDWFLLLCWLLIFLIVMISIECHTEGLNKIIEQNAKMIELQQQMCGDKYGSSNDKTVKKNFK